MQQCMQHIVGFRKIISFKIGIKKYTKLFEKIMLIISFMCLATNCVTNIDQSKRENKK
jgi:hypothetical protein